MKIPAKNPSPQISSMADRFQRPTVQRIIIPELVQAMVLLTTMPCEFDSLSSTILNTNDTAELTFKLVQDSIIAEQQRRLAVGQSGAPPQVNKLSAVKRKGD